MISCTDYLPHSAGSLSSEFSMPKSKLPMALAFFLDFALTSPSRTLSQTWLSPPSGLQSTPGQLASLSQRQRLKHCTLGSCTGPVHRTPFTIHQSGGSSPPYTILSLSIPCSGSSEWHMRRGQACLAQSSLAGGAFQESQSFSKDRVWG